MEQIFACENIWSALCLNYVFEYPYCNLQALACPIGLDTTPP